MRSFLLLIALVCCTCGTAAAQSPVSVRATVGATAIRTPDVLSELLGSGYDVGLDVSVDLTPYLAVTAGSNYSRFPLDRDAAAFAIADTGRETFGDVTFDPATLEVLAGSIGFIVRYPTDDTFSPYARGSAGLHHVLLPPFRWTEERPSGDVTQRFRADSALRFGYDIGLGASFKINHAYSFFAETRYTVVRMGDVQSDTFLNTNSRIGYWPFHLGLQWRPFASPPPEEDSL